jgi:hypothetical protein
MLGLPFYSHVECNPNIYMLGLPFYSHIECNPNIYMLGLPFYSHIECNCMTASIHYEGRFGPIQLV